MKKILNALLATVTTLTLVTGCATRVPTNLATHLEGKPTQSRKYNLESFMLGGAEYLVDKHPTRITLLGQPYTTPTIMKKQESISDHYSDRIIFAPENPDNLYAVVPINYLSNDRKKLCITNPQNDKNDLSTLPPKFDIKRRADKSQEFKIKKLTMNPIKISQTINLPVLGNSYIFKCDFPITNESETLYNTPMIIIPTKNAGIREDYTTKERKIIGKAHAIIPISKLEKIANKKDEIPGGTTP